MPSSMSCCRAFWMASRRPVLLLSTAMPSGWVSQPTGGFGSTTISNVAPSSVVKAMKPPVERVGEVAHDLAALHGQQRGRLIGELADGHFRLALGLEQLVEPGQGIRLGGALLAADVLACQALEGW